MVDALIEIAQQARDVASYERAVFEHFERDVGFDVGLFVRDGKLGPAAIGLDAHLETTYAKRHGTYANELRAFTASAIASGGVAIDTEFFTRAALQRTSWHTELVRPMRGRHSMIGVLEFGGRPAGVLILGRTRTTRFRDADKATLRRALSTLAVADVAVRGAARAVRLQSLAPREREIASYLRLGYTNRQIAEACGTSYRTVRNQLSSIFTKLGVANRTEALGQLDRTLVP